MVKLKRLNTRGGLRKKKSLTDPNALLIGAIWDAFGGIKKVSDLLELPFQTPLNWRLRGKVPLVYAKQVSSALKIPIYGLNYKELSTLMEVPEWKEVVKSYGLPKGVELSILKQSKDL